MATDSYHTGGRDYGYDTSYGYGRDGAMDSGRHMNSSNPRLDDGYLHYRSNDGMGHNIGGSVHGDASIGNYNVGGSSSHLNAGGMVPAEDLHSHHSQQFEPYANLPPPRTTSDYPNVWDREATAGDEADFGSPLPPAGGTLSRADKFGTVDLYQNDRSPSAIGSERAGYRYDPASGLDDMSNQGRPSSNLGYRVEDDPNRMDRIEPSWQTQDFAPPAVTTDLVIGGGGIGMTDGNIRNLSSPPDDGWRNPELQEVIEFLSSPNDRIKANAAAYLQHLCFGNDSVKAETRSLGGIQPLIELLYSEMPEVYLSAVGALRNLSYNRNNDENKREIRKCGGIQGLVSLLQRSPRSDVRELVTATLWNLSSFDELKGIIISHAVPTLVDIVILPHAGLEKRPPDGYVSQQREIYWSTVFRNASGVIRNVSSDGNIARKKLRETDGLVDSLVHTVRSAIANNDIDNKSVENCVCTLRNLCYACQEVVDPSYLRKRERARAQAQQNKGGNKAGPGCLGKKSSGKPADSAATANGAAGNSQAPLITRPLTGPASGQDLLWQSHIVELYLPILSECSNPETLEAAAGAIQNLAACDWQPSVEIRTEVRKLKGLPIMVELLNIGSDRVVCAAATALRNLAIDQRNKELIGKYAMEQLVARLPRDGEENRTSNETIAAVLATIYTVIKGNSDFASQFLEQNGVHRCMYITTSRRFNPKATQFAYTILRTMWQFKELHKRYTELGWSSANFGERSGRPFGGKSHATVDASMAEPGMAQSGPSARINTLPRDKMVQRGHIPPPEANKPVQPNHMSTMQTDPGYGTVEVGPAIPASAGGSYSVQVSGVDGMRGSQQQLHLQSHGQPMGLSTGDVQLETRPYYDAQVDSGVSLNRQQFSDSRSGMLHTLNDTGMGYDNAALDTGYSTEAPNTLPRSVQGTHAQYGDQDLHVATGPTVGYDNSAFLNGGVVGYSYLPDDIPMQNLTLNDYNPYSHNSLDRRSAHSASHSYHQSNTSVNRVGVDATFTHPEEPAVGGMEPLYARVDREKKLSSRRFQGSNGSGLNLSAAGGYEVDAQLNVNASVSIAPVSVTAAGADSWV